MPRTMNVERKHIENYFRTVPLEVATAVLKSGIMIVRLRADEAFAQGLQADGKPPIEQPINGEIVGAESRQASINRSQAATIVKKHRRKKAQEAAGTNGAEPPKENKQTSFKPSEFEEGEKESTKAESA